MGQRGPGGALDKDKASPANGGVGKSNPRKQTRASSRSTDASSEQNRTTTGQGAAAGSAKLRPSNARRSDSSFKAAESGTGKLNVSVTVGTRIPASVHVHPLPQQVIIIYPEWRGYDYILVGDQIVVINPRTHEIVAILEA